MVDSYSYVSGLGGIICASSYPSTFFSDLISRFHKLVGLYFYDELSVDKICGRFLSIRTTY